MAQKTDKKQESVKAYLLKNIIFTILGMVIIVFLLITLTMWGLKSYTRHGEAVKVPNIKGLSIEVAEKKLDQMDLRHEVISSMYTGAKPGSVIEVIPEEQSNVKKDRVVYLVIEPTTPQLITLPDLHNYSSRQAITRLNSFGFKHVNVITKPSIYKGLIIDIMVNGQSLTNATQLPKDTPITLVVGEGNQPIIDSIFDGLIDSLDLDIPIEEYENTENPYFD